MIQYVTLSYIPSCSRQVVQSAPTAVTPNNKRHVFYLAVAAASAVSLQSVISALSRKIQIHNTIEEMLFGWLRSVQNIAMLSEHIRSPSDGLFH